MNKYVKKKKLDKYLSLFHKAEIKQLWNIKVTVIPVVVGTLGKVPKKLVKRLRELEIR